MQAILGRLIIAGRSLIAIVAGAVLAALIVTIISLARGDLGSYIRSLPLAAFALVLSAWAVATFAGSWLTAAIAGRSPLRHTMALGIVFLMAGTANLLILPHPIWVWFASLAVFPLFSYLGARIGLRRRQSLG